MLGPSSHCSDEKAEVPRGTKWPNIKQVGPGDAAESCILALFQAPGSLHRPHTPWLPTSPQWPLGFVLRQAAGGSRGCVPTMLTFPQFLCLWAPLLDLPPRTRWLSLPCLLQPPVLPHITAPTLCSDFRLKCQSLLNSGKARPSPSHAHVPLHRAWCPAQTRCFCYYQLTKCGGR